MWCDYKDKVDELTMELNKTAFELEELKQTLHDRIQMLANTKARFAMMLSEARSNLAAGKEELKAKQQQTEDVDKAYKIEEKDLVEAMLQRQGALHLCSACVPA